MSNTLLNGNTVSLYLLTGSGPDVYKIVTCATDTSLSASNDIIESKTKCGTERKAGTQSWEMSFSGKINTTPGTTEVSFAEMWAIFSGKTKSHFAFQDADAASVGFEGDGYITKFDITAQTDTDVEFSMTITGSGDLTLIP